MKIAHNKLFARKNLTDDEKIALGMLEDGDFAIANTIKRAKRTTTHSKYSKVSPINCLERDV